MTIAQALFAATKQLSRAHIENPQLEAEILLAHLLGKERIWFYLHPEFLIEDHVNKQYVALVERRAMHEPTAYILEQREFWSLPFRVTRDTLIPRPETELIVEISLALVKQERWHRPFILDLGTGCGILAITLACEIPEAALVATDRSFLALIVAYQNAKRFGVKSRVNLVQADWIKPFKSCETSISPPEKGIASAKQGFHLVVSNPPYVANKDKRLLAKEIFKYEPEGSLFSGKDGLEDIEKLIKAVPQVLRKEAWFICEIGHDQGEQVIQMIRDTGMYKCIEIRKDLSGKDRVLMAKRT
ncbi:MAG: peptide chain release factor N(5)-glutamine methyltransferase [Deltaproteobacteria bacterium]|nr:peptide chain release factor N(5)-glutamine methyltransferase [Deltaproteobacteria bacterium]MBW2351433.1 peptide chain release factor N(5)-glutamine methyltransferase [Deltaproteobacteria bacterium]